MDSESQEKKKKKFNFRTAVWPKYVISASTLALATTITLGVLYGNSKHNDAKLGKKSNIDNESLRNNFFKLEDAKAFLISTDKTFNVGEYDFQNNKVVVNGKAIDVVNFLDNYYKENKNLPFLKVTYGAFNFYNEYLEAVSPSEFFEFTKWFMKNVSWGPEIITLKSFSIVKGVEMQGNSITLGAHSNKNKELTTIKFFPDAFFGSLPIYSELSGMGNAPDSLTYKINKKLLTSPQINSFLSKISRYNAYSNLSKKSLELFGFRTINNYTNLKGKKVWTIKKEWLNNINPYLVNEISKNRMNLKSPYILLINGKTKEEAIANLKKQLAEYKDHDYFKILKGLENLPLEEKQISYVNKKVNLFNDLNKVKDTYLEIIFDDGSSFCLFDGFDNIQYSHISGNFQSKNNAISIDKAFINEINNAHKLIDEFSETIRLFFTQNADYSNIEKYLEVLRLKIKTEKNENPKDISFEGLEQIIFENNQLKDQLYEFLSQKQTTEREIEEVRLKIIQIQNKIDLLHSQGISTLQEEQELKVLNNKIKVLLLKLKNVKNKIVSTKSLIKSDEEISLINSKHNTLLSLNNQLKSLESVVNKQEDPVEDKKYKQHLETLVFNFYEFQKEEEIEKLNEEIPNNLGFEVYKFKLEKIKKLNTLLYEYKQKLLKIKKPLFDDQSYSPEPKNVWNYYATDIAFLPNQNISLDSLEKIIGQAHLNWRDFYGLNQYLTDWSLNQKEDSKSFYVYSKKLKSLEEEFIKKHPQAKDIFEYKKIENEFKYLEKKKENLSAKYTEFLNKWTSEKEESIFSLLVRWSSDDLFLPNNFRLLGFDPKHDIFDAKSWKEWSELNFAHIQEYLNKAINDPVLGFKKYYEDLKNTIPVVNKSRFEELIDTIKDRLVKLDETKIDASNDKLLELTNTIIKVNKLGDAWDRDFSSQPWFISFYQLVQIVNFERDLDKAVVLANELVSKKEAFKNIYLELGKIEYQSRFLKFKIDFLTQTPNLSETKILKAYKEVISKYQETSVQNTYLITEEFNKLIEWFNAKHFQKMNLVKNIDKQPSIAYGAQYNNISQVDDDIALYESNKNKQENLKTELVNKITLAKTELEAKRLALDTKLKAISSDETNTGSPKMFDYFLQQIDVIVEAINKKALDKVDAHLLEYLDSPNTILNDPRFQELLNIINDPNSTAQNKKDAKTKITKILLEIQEYQREIVPYKQVVKELKEFKEVYEELKNSVQNHQETPYEIVRLNNAFSQYLARIKEDKSLPSISRRYCEQINTALKEVFEKIAISSSKFVNEKRNYDKSFDELFELVSQKEKAETYVKAYEFHILNLNNAKTNWADVQVHKDVIKKESIAKDAYEDASSITEAIFPKIFKNLSYATAKTSIEKRILGLQDKVNEFLNTNEKIYQANELANKLEQSNNNSSYNKAQLKLDKKEKEIGISKIVKKYNKTLDKLDSIILNFRKNYDFAIHLKAVKSIFRFNAHSAQDLKDEFNSLSWETETKNAVLKIIDDFDFIFDKYQNPFEILKKELQDLNEELKNLAQELINKLPDISEERKTMLDEIIKVEDFLRKSYSLVNPQHFNFKDISNLVSLLNKSLSDIDQEKSKEIKNQKISSYYEDKISNLEYSILSLNENFESQVNSLINLYSPLLQHQYLTTYALKEKMIRIFLPFADKLAIDKEKELIVLEAEIAILKDKKNGLTSQVAALNVLISQKESLGLDATEEKNLKTQLENELTQVTDVLLTKENLAAETFNFKINCALSLVTDFLDFKNKEYAEVQVTLPGLVNPQLLYNANIKKYLDAKKKYNLSFKKIDEFLNGFKNYFAISISEYLEIKNLDFLVKEASKYAIALIKESTIKELVTQTKEESLSNNEYKGEYLEDSKDLVIAKTKIELIEKLTKLGIINSEILSNETELNKLIHKMTWTNVQKQGKDLIISLRGIDAFAKFGHNDFNETRKFDFNEKYLKIYLNADAKNEQIEVIDEFFKTIDYKKTVAPVIIKEEGNIRDPKTGKTTKGYSIFVDAYQNLTKNLLEKVPYAGEWLEGEHLVSRLNTNGEIEYVIENGTYLGFNKDSRIGLWAILKMSDPSFKGISTDFLKFVGAHEYGHHMTLNSASDLGNKNSNGVLISALTPGGSPDIQNYYSKDIIELYLKARTHLDLTTSRLLKDKLDDFGEYAIFKFPKFINHVLKFDEEQSSEVWGTNIHDDKLVQALKNKKRRFLQSFQGLIDATRARQEANGLVTPEQRKWLQEFDLWIANALDHHSGTLNPSHTGEAKYFSYDPILKKYKFSKASLKMLEGILKDGKGNKIQFEEIDGEVLPKIVEGEKNAQGDFIKITKVLIYNNDQTPVINVPLNVDLSDSTREDYDPRDIEFIKEKLKTITNTIKSLIIEKFTINGWDNDLTSLSTEPMTMFANFGLKQALSDLLPNNYYQSLNNIYADFIKNRDNQNGKLLDSNAKLKFYNYDGTVNQEATNKISELVPSSIYANIPLAHNYINPMNPKLTISSLMEAMSIFGDKRNNVINGGEGQIIYFSANEQYLPNVQLNDAYADVFFAQGINPEILKALETKKFLKWSSKYLPFVANNVKNSGIWDMLDSHNKFVETNINKPDFANISKLRLNKDMLINDNNLEKGLFKAYIKTEFSDPIDPSAPSASKEWMKFVSVDLSKAKLDRINKVVNWDISYAESKVNIDKFIKGFKKAFDLHKDSLLPEQVTKYEELINKNSKQLWANEIMQRFSQSKLAAYTSSFTFEQIQNNNDLAWIFDQNYGYGAFKINGFNLITPNVDKWEFGIDKFIQTFKQFAQKNNINKLDQINMYDILVLNGQIHSYTDQTIACVELDRLNLIDLYMSFGNGTFRNKPSEDVIQYYSSKVERKFNEYFSDYTYNFAEIINRDNLQITYSPSTSMFGNMPGYLQGLNEANTGLEYVVDGEATKKWLKSLIKYQGDENQKGLKDTINKYEQNLNKERQNRSNNLNKNYENNIFSELANFNEFTELHNNYFGAFKAFNNGWYKDRWYREMLHFELYDEFGNDKVDDTIRIKDLTNKTVNTRARAYWQFYIQSQGIGKRNITSIWRNADKDALAFFGFLSNDVADKAKYLAFEELDEQGNRTGKIRTIKIHKDNTSNIFYYKNQRPNNEINSNARHYISDEEYDYADKNGHHKGKGFTSWVTDFSIMSHYRNKLLDTNKKYAIYFASDEKGTKSLELDLGNYGSITENGKTFKQAPVSITIENNMAILIVKDQFNGVK